MTHSTNLTGFSLTDYWQKGSIIVYEELKFYNSSQRTPLPFTNEKYTNGSIECEGNTSEEKLSFLDTKNFLKDQSRIMPSSIDIPANDSFEYHVQLTQGTIISFNFTCTGGIDFYIFNKDKFLCFLGNNTGKPEFYQNNKSEYCGEWTVQEQEDYYLVWVNNDQYDFDKVLVIKNIILTKPGYSTDKRIIIDPITLNTTSYGEISDFGVPMKDWKINEQVYLKEEGKDYTVFTIMSSKDFSIKIDNKMHNIKCWVLEYHRSMGFTENGYSLQQNWVVWKCKYNGITVKTVLNHILYNATDNSMIAHWLHQKTATKTMNMNIRGQPIINGWLAFLPITIGLLVLVISFLIIIPKMKIKRLKKT